MTAESSSLVTRALAAEVTKKVRERGLVLWVDTDRQYTGFVEGLSAGGFAYPVVPFRGSYLELMLALEPYGNGHIELEEFQDLSVTQIKRRLSGKPKLVVVRSRELDTAGEHGLHLGTFDQTLALLKSALSLLQQAGVERFVITSEATVSDGRLLVPPNRDAALVELELEGTADEKVRVEVYHPDAVEEVTSKVVEGFFDVGRDWRLGKARTGDSSPPAAAPAISPAAHVAVQDWRQLIADEGYRRVLQIVGERRSINEVELQQVLGSPRRVRAFSRSFDDLVKLLPFEVELVTVLGMKAYTRKE